MALFLRKQDLYLLLESAIFFLFTTLNNNHISLVEVIQAILAWSNRPYVCILHINVYLVKDKEVVNLYTQL